MTQPIPSAPSLSLTGAAGSHNIPSTSMQCSTYREEFATDFATLNLTASDPCPLCQVLVGFHPRSPQVATVSSSSHQVLNPIAQAFIKLSAQIPSWSKGEDCKSFLKKLEIILSNSGIPQDSWKKGFIYAIKDQTTLDWVNTNIVNTLSTWDVAKATFTKHFQRAEYSALILRKYDNLRQARDETVQSYSDRFLEVMNEMGRANYDTDFLVINHFVKNLQSHIREKFENHLADKRADANDITFQYTSLNDIISRCIVYDVAGRTTIATNSQRNHNPSNSNSNDSEKKSAVPATGKKLFCETHGHCAHSTKDCRNPNPSVKSASGSSDSKPNNSSQSNSRDLSKVRCNKCLQYGHYAPQCPNPRAVPSNPPAPDATNPPAPQSMAKRSSAPPERLTYGYDSSGKVQQNITSKATTVNESVTQTASSSFSISSPTVPLPPAGSARVWLLDTISSTSLSCLVDTGSDRSFIDADVAAEIGLKIVPTTGKIEFAESGKFGKRIGSTVQKQFIALLVDEAGSITTQSISPTFEIMKLDVSKHHIILGHDILQQLFPTSLPRAFYCRPSRSISSCQLSVVGPAESSAPREAAELLAEGTGLDLGLPSERPDARDPDCSIVSTPDSLEQEYSTHRQILHNHPELQAAISENQTIEGFCSLDSSVFRLDIDEELFRQKGYRKQYNVPNAAESAVDEQISKWLASGKIEPAAPHTPYNSSLTVAPKKDSEGQFRGWRVCLDTRFLNSCIRTVDRFQLPFIRSILEKFNNCQFFSEIDLTEAYLQFQLDPASRPFTAFTWRGRQYQFTGCPFGISSLPSFFQRTISTLFADYEFTIPYLDNIPVGSRTISEHISHLLLVIQRCNQYNLKIKWSDLKLGHAQMNCLGHVLSRDGISLSNSKVEFIRSLERPTTGKQLQSVLGAMTYLRSHIRHFADLTASLEAVKNQATIEWSDDMIRDFEAIKIAISNAPTLNYPDYTKRFCIATDASNSAVGGVLYQPDSNDPEDEITPGNIVAIVSKKLTPPQQRYGAYKKELLSLVYCIRKFHEYIFAKPITVYTDHKPLIYLLNQSDPSNTLNQWLDVLLHYHLTIKYRPGRLNVLPDHLSRVFQAEYPSVWGVPTVPQNWKFIVPAEQQNSAAETEAVQACVVISDVTDDFTDTATTAPLTPSSSSTSASTPSSSVPESSVAADTVINPSTTSSGIDPVANFNGEEDAATTSPSSNPSPIIPSQSTAQSIQTPSPSVVTEINLSNDQLLEKLTQGYQILHESKEQKEVVEKAHSLGHFGVNAVIKHLLKVQRIWFPNMAALVQSVLNNCDSCCRYNIGTVGYNPAQYITSAAPFDHVMIDTSVHLPPTTDGYTALLVIIDVFSGYVILRPIKTTSADAVAAELWSVFALFGCPKILQSDNGPEFSNYLIQALCRVAGIEQRYITPYLPRSDGKVERCIRTCVGIIKKLVHGDTSNWILFVSFAQFSFNSKFTSLTGTSPFHLMFHRVPNELKDYTANGTSIPIDYDTRQWQKFTEKIQSLIYPMIIGRIKKSKDKMVAALNKKRKVLTENHFPVGSVVMLVDPHRNSKWEPKYVGPYYILSRTRAGNYKLRDGTYAQLERSVPPDQLKLISRTLREVDLKNNIFEIAAILDHRGTAPNMDYLVRWKVYNDCTWEPASNFMDDSIIRAYWSSKQN